LKPGKLKEIRQQKGYSQSDLAKKLNLNPSFVSQIESGKSKIPQKYLEKLCFILDVKIEELLEENLEKEVDADLLEISIDIIDSVIDASDITRAERANLLSHTYNMVEEVYTKNISIENLEEHVKKVKENIVKKVAEKKEKKNLFKKLFLKN
jgi:transcriptional regulator with XRE-family HTH domain